jgi:hypothetical protein
MTQGTPKPGQKDDVMRLAEINPEQVSRLLSAYGLALRMVAPENDIPGSFWGDEEAGLVRA